MISKIQSKFKIVNSPEKLTEMLTILINMIKLKIFEPRGACLNDKMSKSTYILDRKIIDDNKEISNVLLNI